MGKGDRRSKKGKIFRGSFGNSRPHVAKTAANATAEAAPSEETKKAPRKKAAPRKKKEEATE